MRKWLYLLGFIFAAGCATSRPLPDPCTLLTVADVELAQGNAFTAAEKSVKTSGGVTVAECYFRLPEESRSVTLELTRAGSPRATHELWEKQFEPKESERKEEKEERESGRETHGVEVPALGEDAIWSGNRVSGALYVRTRDTILRISLGGIGTQELKVERAKLLAKRALARLE